MSDEQHKDFLNSFLGDAHSETSSIIDKFHEKSQSASPEAQGSTSGYLDIDISTLPMKYFYPNGTKIKIKKAEIEDVQMFTSMLDDNYIDVTEKMNTMLSSCVRYIHPNGSIGSYKNLKSGDRMYLLLKIREITFNGTDQFFEKDLTCSSCERDHKVAFRSFTSGDVEETLVNYIMPEKIDKFFNNEIKAFELTIDGTVYRLAPPSLGLEELFVEHTTKLIKEKKNPNVAFLKIIPFLLWDRDSITPEGIEKKEKEFKTLSMKSYQVINKFINALKFGTEGAKYVCPHCNVGGVTDLTFKGGTSNLFLVTYDEFEDLF